MGMKVKRFNVGTKTDVRFNMARARKAIASELRLLRRMSAVAWIRAVMTTEAEGYSSSAQCDWEQWHKEEGRIAQTRYCVKLMRQSNAL
jgi:hypothetical protein